MAKFPTYKEMAKEVAEKALDEYIYKGKTLREWINILAHTQWIPVSDRLPEVMDGTNGECSDDVLICVLDEDGENYTISTGFYGYYPRSTSQQGWWSMWADGCSQLDSKYKVIAWRELPEPYVPDINVVNINCILNKITAEIEDLDVFYDNDYFSSNTDAMFKRNEVLAIIDKYKVERSDKDADSN